MSGMSCRDVQERLDDAFFARREPGAEDRAHAGTCAACGAHRDDLLQIAAMLEAAPTPEPTAALSARTLRRATAELGRAGLPHGFARELVRLLWGPVAALPVVLAWNAAVLSAGAALLAGLVPAELLTVVGSAYVVAAAGWLSLLFGALPFVAHGRARQRLLEVVP